MNKSRQGIIPVYNLENLQSGLKELNTNINGDGQVIKDIAETLMKNRTTIYDYLKGEKLPSLPLAKAIIDTGIYFLQIRFKNQQHEK